VKLPIRTDWVLGEPVKLPIPTDWALGGPVKPPTLMLSGWGLRREPATLVRLTGWVLGLEPLRSPT
jgi:hypothetical protein